MTGQYPLTGVRQATTGPQEAFIAKATEVLSADDRVLAIPVQVGGRIPVDVGGMHDRVEELLARTLTRS